MKLLSNDFVFDFKVKGQGHDLWSFQAILIKKKCSNSVQLVHTYG